jgi:hypothetical protein
LGGCKASQPLGMAAKPPTFLWAQLACLSCHATVLWHGAIKFALYRRVRHLAYWLGGDLPRGWEGRGPASHHQHILSDGLAVGSRSLQISLSLAWSKGW